MQTLGSTKKDFTYAIHSRINSICAQIDGRAKEAHGEAVRVALGKLNADPDYTAVIDRMAELVGDQSAVQLLATFAPRTVSYGWYRDSDELWTTGGILRPLLVKAGLPAEQFVDDRSMDHLDNEFLYLTGAFATSKVKYWDSLYPPTKAFIEALNNDLDLEALRAILVAYIEALRAEA